MELNVEIVNGTLDISTDHYPIIIKLPLIEHEVNNKIATIRKINKINMVNFKAELQEIVENIDFSSDSNFSSNCIDFKLFSGKLLDKHAPLITRNVPKQLKPQWIDVGFMKSRSKRRKLEKIWRKNKTDENRKNNVEQRNLCSQLSFPKQQTYYSKLVDASSDNQKSLFKIVDELLDKKSKQILPTHTDPLKLANEFNEYYVEKIDKLQETIPSIKENNVIITTEKFEGDV